MCVCVCVCMCVCVCVCVQRVLMHKLVLIHKYLNKNKKKSWQICNTPGNALHVSSNYRA